MNVRDKIINLMSDLEDQGIDCASCTSSECCTFVKNSMMITPLETVELIQFLFKEGRLNTDLFELLKENIRGYRLDIPIPSDGKRNFARRTYTCPFLNTGANACTISRKAKPYGCLGFNSTTKGAIDSTNCRSNQIVLEEVSNEFRDYLKNQNNLVSELLDLNFDKLPIPVAILNILENNKIEKVLSIKIS
jgi:Fe-S-cluster containining protein